MDEDARLPHHRLAIVSVVIIHISSGGTVITRFECIKCGSCGLKISFRKIKLMPKKVEERLDNYVCKTFIGRVYCFCHHFLFIFLVSAYD